MDNFKLIEALIYVQGIKGVTPRNLKDTLEISVGEARKELKEFMKEFNKQERGIMVVEFNDSFKFATKAEYKDAISKMVIIEKKRKLSNSAIETAGIIAYKQPITKSQINEIRGVASEAVVNTLLLKGLVEEKGVAKSPGSPVLYGISDKFYDYFQMTSLKELPNLEEINDSDLEDGFELFESQRGKPEEVLEDEIETEVEDMEITEIQEETNVEMDLEGDDETEIIIPDDNQEEINIEEGDDQIIIPNETQEEVDLDEESDDESFVTDETEIQSDVTDATIN